MAGEVYSEKQRERFWSHVDRSGGTSACWVWKACLQGTGYGQAVVGRRRMGAHRLAWILERGPIVDGLFVLHHCDTRPCVNPSHLYLGTQKDNMRDCWERGRAAFQKDAAAVRARSGAPGTRHSRAKLTEVSAAELIQRYRRGGITQRALAAEYGVHQSIISEVINGKRWPHVDRGE